MKGDFSRDTFNPRKHYTGVLMQQGRVQLDADWNEQHSITRHRTETESSDVVGESGAPAHNAGFLLSTPDGKAVTIGQGRYYVGGYLCENEADVDYLQQPDLLNSPAIANLLQAAGATVAILYLEAWRRTVTALDDAEIREVALGGPDTAVRCKMVWQVKALPVKPAGSGGAACGDAFPEWDALVAPGTGRLSARSQPTQSTGNPCMLPPGAGYQRLENQLYRVEIHQGGAAGTANFKWSRDNGSVVTAVESFNGQQLTVHDLGRDDTLGFSNGQSVELIDDSVELSGQPGQFFTIDHVVEASRIIVLTAAPTAVNLALHPKLRRWDAPLATVGGREGSRKYREGGRDSTESRREHTRFRDAPRRRSGDGTLLHPGAAAAVHLVAEHQLTHGPTLLVLASAGDRAAADFVSRSHAAGAALLYPRDLSRPGWLFSPNDPADATVCVAGERVRLSDIPGILPRLAAVTEADLPHIVAEDRAYIASEMTAFLLALLASAGARTINRPTPQCLCGPAWTDAKWRRTAATLGLPVSPRHTQARLGALRSGDVEPSPVLVGVVGGRCPAEPDPDRAATAIALARVAEADLLTVAFDGPGPDARILRAYPWVDLDDPETERAVLMLFGVQSAMGGARVMQDLVLHDSALGT